MYHSPQSFVPVFDWQDLLERGDVVLFRFPVNDDADAPAEQPKRRPCLVLDVFDLNGTKFVELAYGTSSPQKPTAAMRSGSTKQPRATPQASTAHHALSAHAASSSA